MKLTASSSAVLAFSIVFGAFAANVLYGAMNSVPRAQLETAEAYGMTRRQMNRRILIPQMWAYAVPGLSNLWMILIKATPLLFLLGVEDIVYWARQLGASKTSSFAYPHPDWRLYYFLAILVFYLLMTAVSERAAPVDAPSVEGPSDAGRGSHAKGGRMSCGQTILDYGLRSIGIGEKLLPRTEFDLCTQATLIGSGLIWNLYFGFFALLFGFFLANALAMARASDRAWIRKPAEAFIFVFLRQPAVHPVLPGLPAVRPVAPNGHRGFRHHRGHRLADQGLGGRADRADPEHHRLFGRDLLWRAANRPQGRSGGPPMPTWHDRLENAIAGSSCRR